MHRTPSIKNAAAQILIFAIIKVALIKKRLLRASFGSLKKTPEYGGRDSREIPALKLLAAPRQAKRRDCNLSLSNHREVLVSPPAEEPIAPQTP